MPRQETAINDTSAPFRLTLPNPSTYTTTDGTNTTNNITGFNYMLNNFLHLDVYQPPANHNDCSGGHTKQTVIKITIVNLLEVNVLQIIVYQLLIMHKPQLDILYLMLVVSIQHKI